MIQCFNPLTKVAIHVDPKIMMANMAVNLKLDLPSFRRESSRGQVKCPVFFGSFSFKNKGNYHRKDIKIYNPSKTRDECPQVVPEFDHRLYHLPVQVPIKLHKLRVEKKYPRLARALRCFDKFHLATPFVSDLFAKIQAATQPFLEKLLLEF